MLAALLFASACSPSDESGDGGTPDGGDGGDVCAHADAAAYAYPTPGGPCCDEEYFVCWTPTYQCCHGVWIEYNDGPCMPGPDSGAPDCATNPTARGCPCTAGSASFCSPFQAREECIGGVWTASGTHACCI